MTVRIDEEILLSDFIGWRQLGAIRHLLGGEERNGMRGKILEYAERVARMPKIGDDSHVAFLHYFMGGADWYILEKDTGNEGQIQAFGWAEILPGCGEYGYISIKEITDAGAELDLYWTPKPMAEVLRCR